MEPESNFIIDDIQRALDKRVTDSINQINIVPTLPAIVTKSRDFEVFTRRERDDIIEMKTNAIRVTDFALKFLTLHNALMPEGLILAGGCFSSFFHGQEIKDYDAFVLKDKNFDSTCHAIDKFISDNNIATTITPMSYNSNSRFRIGNSAYINNANNKNKITKTIFDTLTKVQFIITEFATREELIDHFDCEHACVSFDIHANKLYISRSTYDCIVNKLVRRHKENEILAWRKQKFKALGWTVL